MDTETFSAEYEAILGRIDLKNPEMGDILRGLRAKIAARDPVAHAIAQDHERWRTTQLRATASGLPSDVRASCAQADRSWPAIRGLGQEIRAGSRTVCLVGPPRCGKSTAAGLWLLAQDGGLWRTSATLAALRESVHADRPELFRVRAAPFLVIDDLHRGAESADDHARIGEIVSARHDALLLTVVTSNRRPQLGEAALARLRICDCVAPAAPL